MLSKPGHHHDGKTSPNTRTLDTRYRSHLAELQKCVTKRATRFGGGTFRTQTSRKCKLETRVWVVSRPNQEQNRTEAPHVHVMYIPLEAAHTYIYMPFDYRSFWLSALAAANVSQPAPLSSLNGGKVPRVFVYHLQAGAPWQDQRDPRSFANHPESDARRGTLADDPAQPGGINERVFGPTAEHHAGAYTVNKNAGQYMHAGPEPPRSSASRIRPPILTASRSHLPLRRLQPRLDDPLASRQIDRLPHE